MSDETVDLKRSRRKKQTLDPDLRLPPSSREAEQGILGCCLLDPREALPEAVSKIQSPEVFYELQHRTIWETIYEMHNDGDALDLITLQARLKAFGQLEAVGGLAYLSSLPDGVPSAANLDHYIAIVLEKFQARKLIQLCTETIGSIYEYEGDLPQILDQFEGRALTVRQADEDSLHSCATAVNMALEKIRAYQEEPGKVQGIGTGFKGVDSLTGGLQPGLMYVVAGRTSRGKTSFAMNIAAYVAKDLQLPVGVFSLETTVDQLMMRLLCSLAEVNSRDIRNGVLNPQEADRIRDQAKILRKTKLFIDNTPGLPIPRLRAKARRMVQRYGVKLFIIDYLQLVGAIHVRGMTREQAVAGISNGIKLIGQELNVPVIVLSQLNRELDKEKRKPRLSDLRESGAIEQDSDVCMILYSDLNDEDFREKDIPTVNVLVAKNKDGACGEARLTFKKTITKFEDEKAPEEQVALPYKES